MLADDQARFRKALLFNLGSSSRLDVIGEADNGLGLLDLMARQVPDVVLLDLEMPVLDGHKTLEIISGTYPSVRTIILSVHYHEYYMGQLMLQGAAGYLPKSAFCETIVKTVETAYEEGFCFSENISREVIASLLGNEKGYLISERILSDREIRIVKAICNGRTYKEAAAELNISMDTVKFHIKSIYKKTQINSIAGLVKYAIKVGITTVDLT